MKLIKRMSAVALDALPNETVSPSFRYNYLNDTMHFPFSARCVALRTSSPLELGDQVEVIGMAPEDECEREMFVLITWKRRQLAVPLMQLEGMEVDEQTRQAIEDWHYWVERGYEF